MAPMSTKQNEERVSAISSQYRRRAESVAAGAEREREREKAEKVAIDKRRAEQHGEPKQDGEELPKESWKRDDIVDYLVRAGAIESKDDVDGQTKAELIDNFIDHEG